MHTLKGPFDSFMSQLLETNATLDFYCDFNKIKQKVEDVKISLNTLNYLLGQQDLESAVQSLWERDKVRMGHRQEPTRHDGLQHGMAQSLS